MSLRTDPLIGITQSIDDASKPYDGPMAFEKPISCKECLATQAERRPRPDCRSWWEPRLSWKAP